MGKKHKHEEHVNHERWVISFADMMTLLFALFVVLYAMGVQDLEKLKQLKKSIQFAFNIAGSGKTQDVGIFDKQTGAGEISMPAPLVTAQDDAMEEFLKDVLEDFEKVAGKSVDVNVTNDTVTLTAPMSDFFEPNQAYPVKQGVQRWLDETIDGSLSFTSDIRVVVEMANVPIFRRPDGRVVTSVELGIDRLVTIGRLIEANPRVRPNMVAHEWRLQDEQPARGDWEEQAVVVIAFSNTRPENR